MKSSILFLCMWGYGSGIYSSFGLAVLTIPPIFSLPFFCYHLRNPFTFDESSVAEITLYYRRAFDSWMPVSRFRRGSSITGGIDLGQIPFSALLSTFAI